MFGKNKENIGIKQYKSINFGNISCFFVDIIVSEDIIGEINYPFRTKARFLSKGEGDE